MTNNGGSKTRNLGTVVYDSGAEAPSGKKRIGISATEIELLDDIPPAVGTGTTVSNSTQVAKQGRVLESQTLSSAADQQKQQNNYQTLSYNRDQAKPNVVYQDGNNRHVHSAFDRLIDKYAPDAIPQNIINSSTTTRQPFSQVNTGMTREEQSYPIFQTAPSSPTTPSNDYSTVIRPKSGQMPPNQSQTRNNNNQTTTQQRPPTNYDSFQSFTSPPQQQRQQPPQSSVSVKTNSGNFTQVVPGKLYNLHDDPLHLLYDRQPPASSNSQQSARPQQPPFKTTFQPSNNFQTAQAPQTVVFNNDSQRYPQQSVPLTSNTNFNDMEPFDLGGLIKRVQQDYLREIQPFVSSVKFVEKDQEYGQSLADVGFSTPVTVRKGFSRQADDILRHSAGRQGRHQTTTNRPQGRTQYSDDDDDDDYIEELRPSKRRQRLEKLDSKQSFTSVTSISTTGSDYDSQYSSLYPRDSANIHDQSTSPPPKVDLSKVPPQTKNTPATLPSKPIAHTERDKEDKPSVAPPPVATKLATRISSDRRSTTSTEESLTDDQEDDIAKYNEHENTQNTPSKPRETVNALITNSPIIDGSNKTARERVNQGNKVQRSEDIQPVPPTVPSSQPNFKPSTNLRAPTKKSETEDSHSVISGSVNYSDTEDDSYNHQAAPVNTVASRSGVQPNTPTASRLGVQTNPTAITRTAGPGNPSATTVGPSSNTPATTPRTTTTQNPAANPRTTTDNNSRVLSKPEANPNIHFVPNDQRNTTAQRTGPATTATNQPPSTGGATAAQTGSTRLFKQETDAKPSTRQTIKEAPATLGNKIKNLFRRK